MANTYDYVQDIIGMDPNAQTNPIHKLEPEFVPGADMFGIGDKAETLELIDVLKGNSINRINICFPLDANDEALIKHTITAIQDILMGRIHVSMSNINTIDNVKFLQKECGNGISYFSKAAKVPDVEEYCRVESIPFLPVASNGKDFLQRIAE